MLIDMSKSVIFTAIGDELNKLRGGDRRLVLFFLWPMVFSCVVCAGV